MIEDSRDLMGDSTNGNSECRLEVFDVQSIIICGQTLGDASKEPVQRQ